MVFRLHVVTTFSNLYDFSYAIRVSAEVYLLIVFSRWSNKTAPSFSITKTLLYAIITGHHKIVPIAKLLQCTKLYATRLSDYENPLLHILLAHIIQLFYGHMFIVRTISCTISFVCNQHTHTIPSKSVLYFTTCRITQSDRMDCPFF